MARLSHKSYEQMRVIVLEFLDTTIFKLSIDNCVAFLDPLIEFWDIDLATFGMEIVLNSRVASGHLKKLEFLERDPEQRLYEEREYKAFLQDSSLSGDPNAD